MYNVNMTKKRKGIIASFGVMLLQGWEGTIIMLFALVASVVGFMASPAFAAASLFAKEIFTFILSVLFLGNKNIVNIVKKGFTKSGLRYAVGFIIGSSLGSIFFIIALGLAGPGYGTILTAMYPIFTSLLLKIFFREKANKIVWIGIVVTIVGGAMFMTLPSLLQGEEFETSKLIGIGLGAVTALCWSIEGVIINTAHKFKTEWDDKELAVWKSTVSLIFIAIAIMPISMAFDNSYTIFANIFKSWKAIIIVIALALNLVLMRIAYTYSIRQAGVRLTSVIDTNNFLVTPIISTIIYYAADIYYSNDPTSEIFQANIWWSWFLLIPIFIGVYMVITNSDKEIEILDHEK